MNDQFSPCAQFKVGTAGWSVPATYRRAASPASHLEQYARYFKCVEINSSFYKPHRHSTFERWAKSVPADFRFSVKLPKTITHDRRFTDCRDAVTEFCDAVIGLADKLEVVLVQLPPSFAFDAVTVEPALHQLKRSLASRIVCEARHASWFEPGVDKFFDSMNVTRVFADPPIGAIEPAIQPRSYSYLRLHGRPRMYYSAYSSEYLQALAARLAAAATGTGAWCIFDNTTLGAAWPNALELQEALRK